MITCMTNTQNTAAAPTTERTYTEMCELLTQLHRNAAPIELISPAGTRVRVGFTAAKARLAAGYRLA